MFKFHIVKSLFCLLRVSVLKAATIFTVNTVLTYSLTLNPTHRNRKARQYTPTILVSNPTNTSYFRHKGISAFLQLDTSLTSSSITSLSSSLLSNEPYSSVISPTSNRVSCNSQQVPCSAELNFWIFLNVVLMNQSTQNILFIDYFLTNFFYLH